MTITFPFGAMKQAHVCYMLTIEGQAQPLWIGALPLAQLSLFTDAKHNSEFDRIVTPTVTVTVTIIATCFSAEEATAVQFAQIAERKPWCNINGQTMPSSPRNTRTGRVRSITTGTEYPNAAAAARALGVTAQAVGSHLNGRLPTIAGETLERIT